MFDHLSIGVTHLARSISFYDACLKPLGLVRLWDNERAAGYGPVGFEGEAPFALIEFDSQRIVPSLGMHIALSARTRLAVDCFYKEALSAGGIDEGAPGIREHYNSGYYACFVRDPDGYRLEAVLHESL